MDALVVGAGPAGLMAATALARAGRRVVVTEAKPSLGRKLLMAGKSGLNLTKDEPFDRFLSHYHESAPRLRKSLAAFDPNMVQAWAKELGQEVFVGSSGRVFPKVMKASPLLRAWMGQLADLGVEFRTRWRWLGWSEGRWLFDTPDGAAEIAPNVSVLALGGASWPRLGSDGTWFAALRKAGISVTSFQPANAAIAVDWSAHMTCHFGEPVKGTALSAGPVTERGEFVVSSRGLEGGGVYALSRQVRQGLLLTLDLAPDLSAGQVAQRLAAQKSKDSIGNRLRKALNLTPVKLALLMEFGRPLPDGAALPGLVKALPIRHSGLRPLVEAISTAGGVAWAAVDDNLMLKDMPGTFVAGEMLDWEAPTGGYLLTGCLATGLRAGEKAALWHAG
ncbi:MAG: TIGR03862 family flavoprotein [Paracoccaceae bacterium]